MNLDLASTKDVEPCLKWGGQVPERFARISSLERMRNSQPYSCNLRKQEEKAQPNCQVERTAWDAPRVVGCKTIKLTVCSNEEPMNTSGSMVNAGIAQLVEHYLAKVDVASSSLVSRSKTLGVSPRR